MERYIDEGVTRALEDTAVDGAARLITLAAMTQGGTCGPRSLVPELMNEEMFNQAASLAVDRGYVIPLLGSDRLSVGDPPKGTVAWLAHWMSEGNCCSCLTSMATDHYSALALNLLQIGGSMGEWDIIDMMGAPDEVGENALRAAHDHPSVDVLEFDLERHVTAEGQQQAWLEFVYFREGFTGVFA